MAGLPDFKVTVQFWPKNGVTLEQLNVVAAQLDAEAGMNELQDSYSYQQAISLVFHLAPERLHEFLIGWSVHDSWDSLAQPSDD